MAIRVTTQERAAEIRKRFLVCYLCGRGLDVGEATTREHVIPRSLLGRPPSDSAWPVLLDVHKACEIGAKRTQDSWLKLYERFTADPSRLLEELHPLMRQVMDSGAYMDCTATIEGADLQREWIESLCGPLDGVYETWTRLLGSLDLSKEKELTKLRDQCLRLLERLYASPEKQVGRGHYRSAPLTVGQPIPPDMEAPTLAVGVGKDLTNGVWTWVRGLHAFLYGSYLPPDVPHFKAAPVPMFGSRPEHSIEAIAATTGSIQGTLFTAQRLGTWDGVVAWGERLSYQCTWAVCDEESMAAKCCWTLSLPIEFVEARESLFPGTSWNGWYELPVPPPGASTTPTDEGTLARLSLEF